MEGIEQFGQAIRDTFGDKPFSIQDLIIAVPEDSWPPSTRECARMRSRSSSLGKALARVPQAVPLKYRNGRPIWRMLP